jgi:hypothetical protein
VVRLPLHGSYAGVLEIQPADCLVVLPGATRVGDLVVFIILLSEVGKDTTGLEKTDFLPVGKSVRQGGDAAVGVYFEEPAVAI